MTYVKGMKKEKRCFFANIVILMREFLPINTKKYKNVLLNGLQFDSLPYAFEVSGCSPALKNDTIFQPLRKRIVLRREKRKYSHSRSWDIFNHGRIGRSTVRNRGTGKGEKQKKQNAIKEAKKAMDFWMHNRDAGEEKNA